MTKQTNPTQKPAAAQIDAEIEAAAAAMVAALWSKSTVQNGTRVVKVKR
jgi:hypothetical protein